MEKRMDNEMEAGEYIHICIYTLNIYIYTYNKGVRGSIVANMWGMRITEVVAVGIALATS